MWCQRVKRILNHTVNILVFTFSKHIQYLQKEIHFLADKNLNEKNGSATKQITMTTTSVDTSPSNTDSSNSTNSELNTSASSSSPNQESDAHSVQQEVNNY